MVTSSHGILRSQGVDFDTDKSGQKSYFHGKSFAQMVSGKSYKVKVMKDSCNQPHEAEKQIPRVSLASSSHSDEKSKEEEGDKDDEVDISVFGSETNGSSLVAEQFDRHGNGIHCDLVSSEDDSRLNEANLWDNFPCLEGGAGVKIQVTEIVESDGDFYNLSEVGFLNDKAVEGLHLVVYLNPIEEAKETGKGKWKQKLVKNMLSIPKSKKKGGKKK
ncbi:hypothetical protein RHMOL_Rhmol08G0100900 [Rhododendron molle]|uniref:Uncharacterized protein n=1 Tax=Rhododendron molle TaxID=49168 RepID=A0ACC0MMV9_RHOML|nr:hypothetical protein RHMOL_Rhmol08G0100900 [Rhododendron molle]